MTTSRLKGAYMLETILGNKTAQLIMMRLFREDEVAAGTLAKDYNMAVRAFQNQLEKFEDAGLLVSRKIGNLRLFSFNKQSSYIQPLKELIRVEYEKLTDRDIEYFFPRRMRPRKRGKAILEKEDV